MRRILRAAAVAAVAAGLAALPAGTAGAGGTRVGYYDTWEGEGVEAQVPPITAAGGTATQIFDLTPAALSGIDVLFAQNPANEGIGNEWATNLANLTDWVAAGGVIVFHDRWVSYYGSDATATTGGSMGGYLPGGGDLEMYRDFNFADDIDVSDTGTTVTNGPGGTVDDSTLDGGNWSSHGYVVRSSLPEGSIVPLVRGGTATLGAPSGQSSAPESAPAERSGQSTLPGGAVARPDEAVTMCYPYQAGRVIYSTIPLDYYLYFSSPFSDIYAPNAVAWGMNHCGSGGGFGSDARMLQMYLNANGAGPNRHSARLEFRNGAGRASGKVTLQIFQPGNSTPLSSQSQNVFLSPNQMSSATFMFSRPGGTGPWSTRSYQVKGCILITGDTNAANNCITKSFSM